MTPTGCHRHGASLGLSFFGDWPKMPPLRGERISETSPANGMAGGITAGMEASADGTLVR